MRALVTTGLGLGLGAALLAWATAPAGAEQTSLRQEQTSLRQEKSWLYPPEVPARIVVTVPGQGLQRQYWDPRYCAFDGGPLRRARRCPAPAGSGNWYFSF